MGLQIVRLAGPLVLILLLSSINLHRMWDLLGGLQPHAAAAAGAAFVGLLLSRCERWHQLLRAAGLNLRRPDAYLSCLRAIWLGLITPGRVGEFKRGLDLRRHGRLGLADASGLVVIDLLSDVALTGVVALSAVVVAYVRGGPIVEFPYGAWVSLAAVCLAMLLARPVALAGNWMTASFAALGSVAALTMQLSQAPRNVFTLVALTAISNGFFALMMLQLLDGVDPSVHFDSAIVITAAAVLAGALPITYFGLGTREAALIVLVTATGRSREMALALSLTFVAAQLIGFAIALGLDVLLRMAASIQQRPR